MRRGCKSKNCKFYKELCAYRESLKLPGYDQIALCTPDPCSTCKRYYDDGYVPNPEEVKDGTR